MGAKRRLRLGIDVGGTNTDAAVLAGQEVLGAAKVPTSTDLLATVAQAVSCALRACDADADQLAMCMLGTTHFVNACVECRGLSKVAALRLCGTATHSLPPFCSLPTRLRNALEGFHAMLSGGYEYDGGQVIADMCDDEIRSAVVQALHKGCRAFAVSGVFSPVNAAQEEHAAGVIRQVARQHSSDAIHITVSHRIGQLGLLERENAAILNAALQPLAARLVPAFEAAMAQLGVKAELYLTANDGTLMPAKAATELPIATFQSGPVNSLRGAAYLSGVRDGVVSDIGGTTTDVGRLAKGLPCPSSGPTMLAGTRTNFHMPQIASIGLGGGSHVRFAVPSGDTACSVGPESVGHALSVRALACGGDVCTASDVAVVMQRLQLGEHRKAAAGLSSSQADAAWRCIQQSLAAAVDSCKIAAGDVPIVVVGGGAHLCDSHMPGASCVIRPAYASVANAVGAAIPQVSGSVDSVFSMGTAQERRAAVLQQAHALATERAVAAGALLDTCQVVDSEEIPLSYLPGGVTRVRVRVIGTLPVDGSQSTSTAVSGRAAMDQPENIVWGEAAGDASSQGAADVSEHLEGLPEHAASQGWLDEDGDPAVWEPELDASGAWIISHRDLRALTIGTGVLGTGGGGSPYYASLEVAQELDRGARIRVVSPAAVSDDAHVGEGGHMGAPTVGLEKLASFECEQAVLAAEEASKGELRGVISAEIGGGNGLQALLLGARLQLPVIDADLMGRAFPELQMMTSAMYGHKLTPAALVDDKGNKVVVQDAASPLWLERLLRPVCTAMGCSAGLATSPLSGQAMRSCAIQHSMSLAWRLGRAVLAARHAKSDPVAAAAGEGGGRLLFAGKISSVAWILVEVPSKLRRCDMAFMSASCCYQHPLC
ncbi:hypothetical protein WJX73_003020 [Symbiochloris irregularis]|uniref:Hydantoinase/oxoprolinase n=1 Tax=Symbiochloris irregularis TaxID=706552 RepID=A0AAW1P0F1_9CHLO